MKNKILELLKNTDDYVSGQELCERFGVSRTAVWKAINRLKKDGYQIDAIQNRGYRLCGDADVLSQTELEHAIHTQVMGANLVYFEVTDSTNTQAKRLAEEGAPHGTLVVADCQKSGRGRKGRGFDSPGGQSIYMTLLLRPQIAPGNASMLTLVAAIAVQRAISKVAGIKPLIKWPNDIIIGGKKMCGILTEMSMQEDGISYIVIGIGINVQNQTFPDEIKDVATSIFLETGEKANRASIVGAVMEAFEDAYEKFMETQDMTSLLSEYNGLLVNRDEKVRVLDPIAPFEGIARGITNRGELIVETDTEKHMVAYGEVSVRGVYGYV